MNRFTIDGRYKDLLRHYGLDVSEVLRKAQLPGDALNHETVSLTEGEYYRLLDAVGSLSTDAELPVRMATENGIETFSPPIFAAYCSKNGRVCIDRLAAYKKLIGPMSFHLEEGEDELTVGLCPGDPDLDLPSFLVTSEFAFLTGVLRKATGEHISPLRLSFARGPYSSESLVYFAVSAEVGEKNEIVFAAEDLEVPFVTHNDAMWGYFEPELNKRLAELDVDDSVSARVRSALTELLPGGMFTIADVAAELGMSKRSLQRALAAENTTFQKQLNNTREILARHYAANTDMPARDIAYLLGYAEVNSLLRSFSNWTGKGLAEYRAGL